jgi:hypothetical protein
VAGLVDAGAIVHFGHYKNIPAARHVKRNIAALTKALPAWTMEEGDQEER